MARFSKYFIEAAVACFSVMIMMSHADALLMSQDSAVFGPGSITYDTDTCLEWLDLTVTGNLSYNEVLSQLAPGGEYEGWRYASAGEVYMLMVHAGIPNIWFTTKANLEPVCDLAELIGWPLLHVTEGMSGLHSSPLSDGTVWKSRLAIDFSYDPLPWEGEAGVAFPIYPWTASMDFSSSQTGSHLVRECAPVPEPATLLLLVSGLFGVVGFRKKGRN